MVDPRLVQIVFNGLPVATPNLDPALFEENERTAPASDSRQFFHAGDLDCLAGGHLSDVVIAYETWGSLSVDKDNAVLVCHALSGDSHCIGWWERLIGPGKPIDTDRFFVIGSNCLGGCQGSTGPGSEADDGEPYRLRFPMITVEDMVECQQRLVGLLGIPRLYAVAGGSMGGMQAIEWARRGAVEKCFVTASCLAHSAMQIGFNEAARQAVIRDPRWNGGQYESSGPDGGLAVARMIGHLSYLSEHSFDKKFGRELRRGGFQYDFDHEFQVESYLSYQADKFTKRFDANSMLYLTRAIDYYECASLEAADAELLVPAVHLAWVYQPPTG